jgi:Uma2 family endonuclease
MIEMNNAPVSVRKHSLEDLMRLLDEEPPFELIDGEIVYIAPTKFQHSMVAAAIMMAINNFTKDKGLGEAFIETTFVMPDADDPNWVRGSRVPDVLFINIERLASYKSTMPDWEDKPLVLVPDLVVEIVSPTDSYSDIDRKVDGYLRDGVRLVWIIDPKRQRVNVEAVGRKEGLSSEDVLSGEDVIKGFEMPIAAIFE